VLQAVHAHADGATANQVRDYLDAELGMNIRPNHLGIALMRHKRAGRLVEERGRWYVPTGPVTYVPDLARGPGI
jgi:hypothetical protein